MVPQLRRVQVSYVPIRLLLVYKFLSIYFRTTFTWVRSGILLFFVKCQLPTLPMSRRLVLQFGQLQLVRIRNSLRTNAERGLRFGHTRTIVDLRNALVSFPFPQIYSRCSCMGHDMSSNRLFGVSSRKLQKYYSVMRQYSCACVSSLTKLAPGSAVT